MEPDVDADAALASAVELMQPLTVVPANRPSESYNKGQIITIKILINSHCTILHHDP